MNTVLLKLHGYHAWANTELFDALAGLDPQQHAQTLHAALRLINHHHVVSRIFAAHLRGEPHRYTASNTDETPTLDELRAAVAASDAWYLDQVRRITPAELAQAVPFTFTDGDKGCMSREEMLTHVVVHAGYHRGEIGRLLKQISSPLPWDTFAVYLHASEPQRREQPRGDAAQG